MTPRVRSGVSNSDGSNCATKVLLSARSRKPAPNEWGAGAGHKGTGRSFRVRRLLARGPTQLRQYAHRGPLPVIFSAK